VRRLFVVLGVIVSLAGAPAGAAGIVHRDLWLDTATAHAMAGELGVADSLLVALISVYPGDATVLNALGNVRTLEGRPAAARSFYQEAMRRNPAAVGIRFNLASALLELGLDAAAESVATAALIEVGGLEEAHRLLGLRPSPAADDSTGRAGAAKPLNRKDVEALLARAAKRIPKRTPDTAAPSDAKAKQRIVSKPGAQRASGPAESRPALYWGP